ncbi:MAG: hypothetical protein WD708_05755 [Kiritimatiellia bacterium]
MIENLLHLLPGLALQFLLAAALLWLFTRPSDDVPVTHILLSSLGICFLNLLIEWALRDYLLEATVVVQWTFFVLLANHFLSIPLPRAALTLFCFFALMLGAGLLDTRLSPQDLSEEERLLLEGFQAVEIPNPADSKELSPWAIRLRQGILDKRLMGARAVTLRSLYPPSDEEAKTDRKTEVATIPDPTPEPAHETGSDPVEITQSPSMTGKEFEALFAHSPSVQSSGKNGDPLETTEIPDLIAGEAEPPEPDDTIRPDRRHHPGGFNAEQLAEVVEVRNRSTDRRFAHPQFQVGAVSIGEHGRFAIVDGEMLKEGSIVRTNRETPRGWKLHRIEPGELFWQPLK